MILHRLRLSNFRGVADREITFPEHGVVVVCGPNEIGKSSMLEALDLLLEYKDRSNHQRVKQVKPTNADVGAQVEAEISSGPYRFVYRKRFHRKHGTELEVLAPRPENHTGDEAHERVKAILEETVDTRLWQAQRVLQSAATEAVDLSGSDALARALDAAAGEVDTAGGAESLLIDRIDAEYARYFTPSAGRPTREYKDAIGRLAEAEAEAQRCRDLVADVEDRVARHETLTATAAELTEALGPALARRTAAVAAAAALAQLRDEVEQARLQAGAAIGASAASQSAQQQREALIAEAERRAATLAGLAEGLDAADADEHRVRSATEAAQAASATADEAVLAAGRRAEAARAAAQACTDAEEADRLEARIGRIDEARATLDRIDAELSTITLTADVLSDIESADALVQRLADRLASDTGTVVLTAAAGLEITVDGESVTVPAGQDWVASASTPATVELPGVLRVRIEPGATAADLNEKLVAAQQLRDESLAHGGVSDIAAAREVDRRRRELTDSRKEVAATLDGLCIGEDADALRTRLAQLRAVAPRSGLDSAAAAADSQAATAALESARITAEAARSAAEEAGAASHAASTAATLLRDRIATAEAELTAASEQLNQARTAASDEVVAATSAAEAERARAAEQTLAERTARYEQASPAAVDAELTAAHQAADAIAGELDEVQRQLGGLNAQLEVIGGEGRQGLLDEAEAELERARGDHARVEQRAAAVQLLRDTMVRHRDNTRQRYVAPFRAELERLGRIVFGEDFQIDVDIDLTIRGRTLDGCTVPYESLSGGAKEQLGILARLAGAALVAEADTVPVVIDDALGFTDTERLTRMGEVFNTVGDRGQVIVLTCQRDRYAGIEGASVIQLSA